MPIVILRGPRHLVELINQPVLQLLGRSEAELLRQPLFEAVPELRDWGIADLVEEVFQSGESKYLPEFLMRRDCEGEGQLSEEYVTLIFEPLRNAAGDVDGVTGIGFSITEQVRARRRAEESEQRLDAALAASDTGTFRWDPVTDAYLTFDANLKRLFGFAPEDQVRVTEDKLARVHPDDVGPLRAAIERRRHSSAFEMDYRVVYPDGSVHWLHDRGKMEHDAEGRPTYLVGACTDITRRKQSEAAAQASAERWRILMKTIPEKVFTATPSGDIDYFNPQWMEFSGLPFAAIRDWGWTQIIHPEDVEENVRVWRHSIETGEPFQFEHRFRRADGVYRWHLSRALPLKDGDGRILAWFGANTDIDDQKQALQLQEDFMSVATHELKTPLTSIKAYAQALQRRFRRRGDLAAAGQLAKMDDQLDRLTRLISDLLDVTKIEAGELPLDEEFFDFDALVAEAIDALQLISERHRIERRGKAGRPIWGDRDRIGQVVINLLSNAIKYSPEADKVLVETTTDDHSLMFCVHDFGVGIPKVQQARLFGRFQRLSGGTHSNFPGLGLGLFIAAEIVERHGGTIWVESEEGQGATFCVRLPFGIERPPEVMAQGVDEEGPSHGHGSPARSGQDSHRR